MKDAENCLDSQLWHACAGGMVQMASVDSKVYYFPQGHAEHAQGVVDFGTRCIPSLVPCRVSSVKFMADQETDEVYAKIRMVPLRPSEMDFDDDDDLGLRMSRVDAQDKPTSFAKTLTQSDANNGGGFSVPRYCAETIFPRLDYSADPPVQNVLAKDVHGGIWKFRHIYRGTPRRHLLTTGWSTFVNQKKLVAGDSIVFLRTESGDLCVGIRRAKRLGIGGGPENPSRWNSSNGNHGSFSVFLREEDKMMKVEGNGSTLSYGTCMKGKGRVRAESVVEAATLAANGQPFEVVYYPRASTPEFCVKASTVKAALKIRWSPGMRFKMAFETEDCSRISWFMGTISSVQVADPIRWPNSPWRLLQVTWDEPDLLQNVKRVSPWLVELVSNMSSVHLVPFSPPRKKPRIPQNPDFPFEGQFSTPVFPGNPIGPSGSPLCCFPDSTPAGIQGARHAQFGQPLSDLHLNKLQSGLFPMEFHRFDQITPPPSRISNTLVGNHAVHDNVSCLLTIGNPSQSIEKPCNGKPSPLMLFGRPILTEQQISLTSSKDNVFPGTDSSNGNITMKNNVSDGSNSAIIHSGHAASDFGLETGHCKVFMESEDVGRTLDLSVFGSYEELYSRLADMFGIEKSEMMSHVLYKDAAGATKHTGDEPFSDFMKTARRLTILTDSGSENIGRSVLSLNANLQCCR